MTARRDHQEPCVVCHEPIRCGHSIEPGRSFGVRSGWAHSACADRPGVTRSEPHRSRAKRAVDALQNFDWRELLDGPSNDYA